MKYSNILSLITLASSSLAAPAYLDHSHHIHRRDAEPVVVHVTETAVVYVDNQGNVITSTETQTAVDAESSTAEKASYSYNNDNYAESSSVAPSSYSSYSYSAPASSSTPSTFSTVYSSSYVYSSSSSYSKASSSSAYSSQAASSSSSSSSKSTSTSSSSDGLTSNIDGDLSAFSAPSTKFKDGSIKCSDFPSGQGVVAIPWVDLDGWTTIMDMDGNTASTCKDGFYCSYACQPGMSKTQWPSTQPSSGISVGGLYCDNGYLTRSNTDSDYLCEWGKESSNAVNNLEKVVSLCRTDYPGSENMNIPTQVGAGSSLPISVVDSDSYYQWKSGKTSSQYYVNNAGVNAENGCIWGTSASDVGNWAPLVLGAGYTGGITYLSLIPNPNNLVAPNYSVKITASEGSTAVGSCSYVDGVYVGSSTDGCTTSVTKGSANFVFY